MNQFELCVIPESTIHEEPSRSLVDAFEGMLKEIFYDTYVEQLKTDDLPEYNRQLFYFLESYR